MKRRQIVRPALFLGLAGLIALMPGCSTSVLREFRDSAVSGANAFVVDATYALLEALFEQSGVTTGT